MPRLSIRLTDATLAALRRELDSERAFRGRRYSLNDLCVRKLGGSVAPSWQHGDVTERVPQLRTPPPPPIPRTPMMPSPNGLFRVPVEEPQPERSVRPNELRKGGGPDGDKGGATVTPVAPIEDNMVSTWVKDMVETQPMTQDTGYRLERVEPDPNEQAELDTLAGAADAEAEEEARGRWESEGGGDR